MTKQPAGAMGFLFFEGKIMLILRDDKPDISFPNKWSPPTGGLEPDETLPGCMRRELVEEIGFVPRLLMILGVSVKGNAYYFGLLDKGERDRIVLGEGQRYDFFRHDELSRLDIGGAFDVYLRNYPEAMAEMFALRRLPGSDFGKRLKLAVWNGNNPDPPPSDEG